MTHSSPIRVVATGRHLPAGVVSTVAIAAECGVSHEALLRRVGVHSHHVADGVLASTMGAAAARDALSRAGLTLSDVDVLVSASGTAEQPIPCTAARIRAALGEDEARLPCFDVGATCLSFLVALDLLAPHVASGRYRRALIVSAEVASVGVGPRDVEARALFGDGAAAAVIDRRPDESGAALLAARLETYPDGVELAEVRGGGSRIPPRDPAATDEDFRFRMDGRELFRVAARRLPGLVDRLLDVAALTRSDVSLVVPHQASRSAMRLIERRLGFPPERWVRTLTTYGNVVAASIPLTLDAAFRDGRARRGDVVLLLGTSAGYSQGGALLRL